MANNYVITSVMENAAADTLTVTGTVNGTSVTVVMNLSAPGVSAALASAIGFQNLIFPLMLAAYSSIVAPAAVPSLQNLSFSR